MNADDGVAKLTHAHKATVSCARVLRGHSSEIVGARMITDDKGGLAALVPFSFMFWTCFFFDVFPLEVFLCADVEFFTTPPS